MKKQKYSVPISANIWAIVKDNFGDKEISYVERILGFIMFKYLSEWNYFGEFVTISSSQKKTIVGSSSMYSVWSKLVRIGVLEEFEFSDGTKYRTKQKLAKRLRIPIHLLCGDLKSFNYVKNRQKRSAKETIVDMRLRVARNNLEKLSVKDLSEAERKSLYLKYFEKLNDKYLFNSKGLVICSKSNNKPYTALSTSYCHSEFIGFLKNVIPFMVRLQLSSFKNKDFYCSISSSNRRLNSSVTNMNKLLFSSLLMDGEPITRIDLKNSQPLILANVLKASISENNKVGGFFYDSFINNIWNNYHRAKRKACKDMPLLFSFFKSHIFCRELNLFLKVCSKGIVYEYFQRKLDLKSRSEAKGFYIRTLFGISKFAKTSKNFKSFCKVTPSIGEFIFFLKQSCIRRVRDGDAFLEDFRYSKAKGRKTDENLGDSFLSIFLQRVESKIFLEKIFRDLDNNGYDFLTIHDCIICPQSQFEAVHGIIKSQLDECMGDDCYRLEVINKPELKKGIQTSTKYLINLKVA